MNYEKLIQEQHGKEIIIHTKNNRHYQGQLVGCQCKNGQCKCSHLILLLFDINYVDIPVEEISEINFPTNGII